VNLSRFGNGDSAAHRRHIGHASLAKPNGEVCDLPAASSPKGFDELFPSYVHRRFWQRLQFY
jgi:hypothetical protein